MGNKLVVDIGAHDGADTQAFLEQGYRVVAIEADPLKVAALKETHAEPIQSGQCVIIQCGVSNMSGILPFYRCMRDSGMSSFRREFAGSSPEVIEIPIKPLLSVLKPFGRPYYIKCDIEGYDYDALSTLVPEYAPEYISAEIQDRPELLDLFVALGYTKFKLIAQPYGTSSEEIYSHEYGWRALRKASRVIPGLRKAICSLPHRLRAKTEWDTEMNAFSSGPFGEDAFGPWLSESVARTKLRRIMGHVEKAWVDLHAAKELLNHSAGNGHSAYCGDAGGIYDPTVMLPVPVAARKTGFSETSAEPLIRIDQSAQVG